MKELLSGILGEKDLSKYLIIVIIIVLAVLIYLAKERHGGILGLLKGLPIDALLSVASDC